MSTRKEFVAASATPLILSILSRGDSYGYAIIAEVRERSGGTMTWAEGMLYPILHRLERQGLVESYWGKADTGRRRKYYRMCNAGHTELEQQRAEWFKLSAMLQDLQGGPSCAT